MKPMNPQDAMFLMFESGRNPMHVAGLNIYTPPKGEQGPDSTYVADLIESWRGYIAAKAPFNLRPVQRMGRWYWDEDDDFDIDYHVRHLALPRPGRIRELLTMVSRLHGVPLDRNRPLWEVYVIEGFGDGRFATYTKFHHSLIDGVTGTRIMAATMADDAAKSKGKLPFWATEHKHRASAGTTGVKDTLLQKLMQTFQGSKEFAPGLARGVLDMARGLYGTDDRSLPFQAPPCMFNVPITGSRRFVAQSYSLTEFKALGALAGATLNDVTLSVCSGAVRRYLLSQNALPTKPLISMVPVSLHTEGGEGGNSIAFVLCDLATDCADPLERLHRIKASMNAAKDRFRKMSKTEKMAYNVATVQMPALPLMLTGLGKRAPLSNLTISNVPGPKQDLYLEGAHLDEGYPVSIPMDYTAINITVTSYADAFAFGYTACRRTVPGLQRMIDHTDESVAELRKALGYKAKPAVKAKKAKVAVKGKVAKVAKVAKAVKLTKAVKVVKAVKAKPKRGQK